MSCLCVVIRNMLLAIMAYRHHFIKEIFFFENSSGQRVDSRSKTRSQKVKADVVVPLVTSIWNACLFLEGAIGDTTNVQIAKTPIVPSKPWR